MNAQRTLLLIQRLECLSRTSYFAFIRERKIDLPTRIFAWLFEKAIDLVGGIVQLHKSNLDECGQILIRALYENYLNYTHFVNLISLNSREEAASFVVHSIILRREKDILEQVKVSPHYCSLKEQCIDLSQFEEKYFCSVKKIKKYGFLCESVEAVSKKYHKNAEYQVMYRDFSRNVHALDLVDYIAKHEKKENNNHAGSEYIKSQRNQVFGFVFEIFVEMMTAMNRNFFLEIEDELINIKKEYTAI